MCLETLPRKEESLSSAIGLRADCIYLTFPARNERWGKKLFYIRVCGHIESDFHGNQAKTKAHKARVVVRVDMWLIVAFDNQTKLNWYASLSP